MKLSIAAAFTACVACAPTQANQARAATALAVDDAACAALHMVPGQKAEILAALCQLEDGAAHAFVASWETQRLNDGGGQ